LELSHDEHCVPRVLRAYMRAHGGPPAALRVHPEDWHTLELTQPWCVRTTECGQSYLDVPVHLAPDLSVGVVCALQGAEPSGPEFEELIPRDLREYVLVEVLRELEQLMSGQGIPVHIYLNGKPQAVEPAHAHGLVRYLYNKLCTERRVPRLFQLTAQLREEQARRTELVDARVKERLAFAAKALSERCQGTFALVCSTGAALGRLTQTAVPESMARAIWVTQDEAGRRWSVLTKQLAEYVGVLETAYDAAKADGIFAAEESEKT
jgi:hypothetical protein